MKTVESFCVVRYDHSGAFVGVMAGMGTNKGTWDSGHTRRTAQRHAAECRRDDPDHDYRVELTV